MVTPTQAKASIDQSISHSIDGSDITREGGSDGNA
jgi:hypothetical protein